MSAAQILEAVFPIASELTRLELVEVHERDGGISLTVRLIVMEPGEPPTIRDIKEQEVFALAAKHREDPRLAACVEGWALALKHVFDQGVDEIEALMPHDLVLIGGMLQLKRPRTAEDFCDAALAGKQRLGRFLSG